MKQINQIADTWIDSELISALKAGGKSYLDFHLIYSWNIRLERPLTSEEVLTYSGAISFVFGWNTQGVWRDGALTFLHRHDGRFDVETSPLKGARRYSINSIPLEDLANETVRLIEHHIANQN